MKYAALTVAALMSAPALAQIPNGGFETGDFTGWTSVGNSASDAVMGEDARDPVNFGLQPPAGGTWGPTEGNYFASLWSTDGTIASADLRTTFLAGEGFELSFDYFFDYGDLAPSYDAAFATLTANGQTITLFEHNTAGFELADDTNIDWTAVGHIFSGPLAEYTLQFSVVDFDNTFESILGIDNVVLIPAPGVAAVLATAGLVAGRRRRG